MKPAYSIRANGKDVTKTFLPYLMSISTRDESKDEADSLTIVLDNSRTALVAPVQGDQLELLLGYEGNLTSVGIFTVDKSSFTGPPDTLTIQCKSAAFVNPAFNKLQRNFLERKTRSWEPSSILTIAKKIASEHGVELQADPVLLYMPTPHLDQTEEGDTGFLYRVLSPRGYIIKIANNKLIILKRSAGLSVNSNGIALPIVNLNRNEVTNYSGEWTDRSVFDKAISFWHDPTTGLVRYESAGTGKRVFRFKNQAPDQKTAQDWATSVLKQSQGEGGKMSISMPGRADLQSEQRITLTGFPYPLSESPSKDAIAKEWIIKSITHSFTSTGFTTSISGEPFIAL